MPKPPKPWRWGWASQRTALRNARNASAVLEQRRREREEVEAYFAGADGAA
jgi:hypothetical protein